ncbi:MAG: antibiotic biosynthesis monooxygenase [Actinomycetota bacterium]
MSLVKINALAIPPQAGDEIVKRFAARLDEMATVPGFQGFELLQPTGEAETRWFVYTRWADEESYEAWRNSDTFARGHAGSDSTSDDEGQRDGPRPLSTGATLLEFDVRLTAEGPAVD